MIQGVNLRNVLIMKSQNVGILILTILKHLVFHLMEFVKKKNVVIMKVAIVVNIFLMKFQRNVLLMMISVKKYLKNVMKCLMMSVIHIIINLKKKN